MYTLYDFLWLFMIYSFLGWCVEVSFIALTQGRLLNRGFLNGPLCPIYGFGMIGVLTLLEPVSGNLLILFLGGMLVCTALECFVGWALDKIFHMRWWDYTDKPLNFHGYICLSYSVMWGLGSVFVVRIIHPIIIGLVDLLPEKYGLIPLSIIYIAFVVDIIVTVKTMIGITRRLGELDKIAESLNKMGDEVSQLVGTAMIDTSEKISESRERIAENSKEFSERITESSKEFSERIAENSKELTERITESSKEFNERISESNRVRREELQKRIDEMEKRNRELLQSLSKSRILKAFPSVRRDSSSIRLSEELKRFRLRGNNEKKKEAEENNG